MITVHKFAIDLGPNDLRMPKGAELLTAALQGTLMFVWARVDTDQPSETRMVHVVGTGHDAPLGRYVGTIIGYVYVWHVFEGERH